MDKPVDYTRLEKGWRPQNYSAALQITLQLTFSLSSMFSYLLWAEGSGLFVP